MRKTILSRHYMLSLLAALLVLSLSACSTGVDLAATPTLDMSGIATAALQTVTSLESTQAAANPFPLETPAATLGNPFSGSTSAVPNTGESASTAQGCDNATYVSDVTIPDATVMIPGQNFVKTWALINSGTCPWTTDYNLVFVSGEAMGGTSVPLTAAVQPQQTVNLSVSLVAPTVTGIYTGKWRLQNAAGVYFGNTITVVITVSSGGKGSNGDSVVANNAP